MIVYKVTNRINDMSYIGITVTNLKKRWREHRCESSNKNGYLNRAMRKYGVENFTIEQIASAIGSIENLKKVEIELIKQLKTKHPTGYNLTDGGEGTVGYKHTEEQRKRNADAKRGIVGEKAHHFKGKVIATNVKTGATVELFGNLDMTNKGFRFQNIHQCLTNQRKTHKGHTFERVEK